MPKNNSRERNLNLAADLYPQIKERLLRQLKNTSLSLANREKKDTAKINQTIIANYHFHELDQLCGNAKKSRFTYKLALPSLLLVAYKNPPQSLSSNLLNVAETVGMEKFSGLEKMAISILDPSRHDNSLYISSLLYRKDGSLINIPGTIPFFYWPISLESIRNIIFRNILVFTLFNPTHIQRRLAEVGLKAKGTIHENNLSIFKNQNGIQITIKEFVFFMRLIQNNLITDELMISMISNMFIKLEEKGNEITMEKGEFDFQQFFGLPDEIENTD